jgi:hypothetical protein
MAYNGTSNKVSCASGGLTGANNTDTIDASMMVEPSRNIIYERMGRRKRGGTAHLYANAFTGTPGILGLSKVRFEDTTTFLLAATNGGKVYKNDADTIATGLGTTLPYCFEYAGNKVFFCDGVNIPRVWPGTGSAAAISEPATDFTNFPVFQIVLRRVGLAQRLVCLNKHGIYMSKAYTLASDLELFITSAQYIPIDAGSDGKGPQGMMEIGDQLVVFGKQKAYRLDDSDTDPSNWSISPAQWNGGVGNWRLLVKTPNDVIAMMDDGDIYSIEAVETYGDYKLASLVRGCWMYDWIRENVDLSKISLFHGVYDPVIRAVRYFVVRQGSTVPDLCLCYYIDREPTEAWMIEDNQTNPSGHTCLSSTVYSSSTGSYDVLTGDNAGFIWKFNQANRNDNSLGYYGGFKTPPDAFGDSRISKLFNMFHVVTDALGGYDLQLRVWVDEILIGTLMSVDLTGSFVLLDDFTLDDDYLGESEIIQKSFKIGKIGQRIQFELYNDGADEDFFVTSFMTDAKSLGKKSEGGD